MIKKVDFAWMAPRFASLLLLAIVVACAFASGKQICHNKVACQQGTIHYPDGFCACICKKNYEDTHGICKTAFWSTWSPWSRCIKTDWGGLQTRKRVCKSKGRSAPGSCDGKGSMARTCSATNREFRIRKNIDELTDDEIHDLIQAMARFKKDLTAKGYRSIISWHGWPGKCHWYHHIHGHDNGHCSWHNHPLFLPWHRLIMVQLELGLSRYLKNKTLGIPFWDWTNHRTSIPNLIRYSQVYDPVLKKHVKNPFHRTFIKTWNGVNLYTQRYPWVPGLLMDKFFLKGAVRALLSHDYYNFDKQLSRNPHNQVHNCFCMEEKEVFGKSICDFGMPISDYAAFDPVFMLHHSAIDRLFAMRRLLEESQGLSDWTKERVIDQYLAGSSEPTKEMKQSFDWPISPFCNQSINPEPITSERDVWTMHKGYYNEQLFGYKYSNYNLGDNYTWKDLQNDFKKNVKEKNVWNDQIFYTKIGVLTRENSYSLERSQGCVMEYSNPPWNITITWNH